MSTERRSWPSSAMDVKSKFSQDVKKLTSAAAKLRIHPKRKGDKVKEKEEVKSQHQPEAKTAVLEKRLAEEPAKEKLSRHANKPISSQGAKVQEATVRQRPVTGFAETKLESAAVLAKERKFTLSDLLHSLGTYVHLQCRELVSRPTAAEVSMWVRVADKALQLNGWTINSFLLESHVVFTYMLVQQAFERFHVETLTDAKELVLMCLYISYTYNANEISYPLRPFLVKQNRVAFWSKCTELSLSCSSQMLKLNKSRRYYLETLSSLKSVTYCH